MLFALFGHHFWGVKSEYSSQLWEKWWWLEEQKAVSDYAIRFLPSLIFDFLGHVCKYHQTLRAPETIPHNSVVQDLRLSGLGSTLWQAELSLSNSLALLGNLYGFRRPHRKPLY